MDFPGGFGFWISDFGFWILDFGFRILDFGFRILDFGALCSNSSCANFGFWISGFVFWILDFGFWISDFGFRILDFGLGAFSRTFVFWMLHNIKITVHADPGRRIFMSAEQQRSSQSHTAAYRVPASIST